MLANHHRFDRQSGPNRNRWILVAAVAAWTSGCSICPSPYDYDYGTYGTKTPRTDMRHGRVGSLFSDPALGAQAPASSRFHNAQGEIIYGQPVDGQEVIIDGEFIQEGIPSESYPITTGEIIIQ